LDGLLCEEFPGCLPSQIDDEPRVRLLRIVQLRNYARAVEAIDRYADAKAKGQTEGVDEPRGPAVDQVWMIRTERARRAREEL